VAWSDVESLYGGPDWQARAVDRDNWKIAYVTGMSQWPVTPKNKDKEENSLNIIGSR